MTTPALRALEDLARDRTSREGLVSQLAQARRRHDEAVVRHEQAVSTLAAEEADVAQLEAMSMGRILSVLRGTRDAELSREQAEADAARYSALEAEARLEAAARDVTSLEERLARYEDLDARRTQVLAQREQEVRSLGDSPEAARLSAIAEELGRVEAEIIQIDEAHEAAGVSRQALSASELVLGDVVSWSAFDSYMGSQVASHAARYSRLDHTAALMRAADDALGHLATELADVDVHACGGIGVDELTTYFDMWFDASFGDDEVRERVRTSKERVDLALAGVLAVTDELELRRAEARANLTELSAERELLLLAR